MGRGGRRKNPYVNDRFTQQAKQEGFAARSVYKLDEIQRRMPFLKPGMRVVDLGCHPGSWTRYALQAVGRRGKVVGIDIAPTEVPGAEILHASIEDTPPETFRALLGGPADVVLSDMAPRTTGDTFGDHVRQLELARLAAETALALLRPGGHFVVKVFDGEEAHPFVQSLRPHFARCKRMRPEAVRQTSREFFLVCLERTAPAPSGDDAGAAPG